MIKVFKPQLYSKQVIITPSHMQESRGAIKRVCRLKIWNRLQNVKENRWEIIDANKLMPLPVEAPPHFKQAQVDAWPVRSNAEI